jgi:hypothetical protein
MKNALIVLAVALLTGAGCKSKPTVPQLHVVTADTCEWSVVGMIGNKEYTLETKGDNAPLGVACWGPIGMKDVGNDFPAKVDMTLGRVTVMVDGKEQAYEIHKVREVK